MVRKSWIWPPAWWMMRYSNTFCLILVQRRNELRFFRGYNLWGYLISYLTQDIPKATRVISNANPQRVALKETQALKGQGRLQGCLQLSPGTNNFANRQHAQGRSVMTNPHKPASVTQLCAKKDLQGPKPNGKQEQSCSVQRQNHMSSAQTAEPQDENKENKEQGKSNNLKIAR